jgi:hypothetical protein
MRNSKKLVALYLTLFLIGCSDTSSNKSYPTEVNGQSSEPVLPESTMAYDEVSSSEELEYNKSISGDKNADLSAEGQQAATDIIPLQQKLIKTGDLSFETKDIKVTRQNLNGLIKATQSYVSNESEDNYEGRTTNNLTIRIPSANFDDFINKLSVGVELFDYKNIYVTDVTDQYTDTEARIKTKKAIEQKYIALLERANSIDEILEIEKEIGYLRTEIESTEALLKSMTSQIAYSTLTVTFYEIDHTHPQADTPTVSNKFVDALASGWEKILNFLVGLVENWPGVIIFLIILIVVKRNWRKWLGKLKSKFKGTV